MISLFGMLGFLIAPRIHAPFCAAILFHWLTNGNRCIMSGEYDDPNGFTKDLVTMFGLPWPENTSLQKLIPYLLLLVPLSISVIITNLDYFPASCA